MFMGYVGKIRLYKHGLTRHYLNADPDGNTYLYDSEFDEYFPRAAQASDQDRLRRARGAGLQADDQMHAGGHGRASHADGGSGLHRRSDEARGRLKRATSIKGPLLPLHVEYAFVRVKRSEQRRSAPPGSPAEPA